MLDHSKSRTTREVIRRIGVLLSDVAGVRNLKMESGYESKIGAEHIEFA